MLASGPGEAEIVRALAILKQRTGLTIPEAEARAYVTRHGLEWIRKKFILDDSRGEFIVTQHRVWQRRELEEIAVAAGMTFNEALALAAVDALDIRQVI